MSELKDLLTAMQSKKVTKEIKVPSKDLLFKVKELTFKELKAIEKKSKKGDEKDALTFMMSSMTLSVTVGGHVIIGDPLVSSDVLSSVINELTMTGIGELSDGISEVLSLGK